MVTSAKTGIAPINLITEVEDMKELAWVIISSPGLIPRAFKDKINASVPEFKQTTSETPTNFDILFSKFCIIFPPTYCPDDSTKSISFKSSFF